MAGCWDQWWASVKVLGTHNQCGTGEKTGPLCLLVFEKQSGNMFIYHHSIFLAVYSDNTAKTKQMRSPEEKMDSIHGSRLELFNHLFLTNYKWDAFKRHYVASQNIAFDELITSLSTLPKTYSSLSFIWGLVASHRSLIKSRNILCKTPCNKLETTLLQFYCQLVPV